jgi:branched-chain amino acid transport system ATP-binding protein
LAWLEIRDLKAFYHGTEVLHGLDLHVDEGDFVAVIGSNGAGKTTLLRSLSRLVTIQGNIVFGGQDMVRSKPRDCVRHGIIHCPEGRLLFPEMTVLQNLMMGAFLRHDTDGVKRDLERVYDYLPTLANRKNQWAGTLSGGEQQMVAVGRAIMGRPRLLTLDEPSFGLAPLVVNAIFDVIKRLNAEGVTILLVEQNASLALEFSRFAYVLEEGRIVDEGLSTELSTKKSILQAYLGMA